MTINKIDLVYPLQTSIGNIVTTLNHNALDTTPRHKAGSAEGRLPVPCEGASGVGGAGGGGIQMATGSIPAGNFIAVFAEKYWLGMVGPR